MFVDGLICSNLQVLMLATHEMTHNFALGIVGSILRLVAYEMSKLKK